MFRPTALPTADRRARAGGFFVITWLVAFGAGWILQAIVRAANQFFLIIPGMEADWRLAIALAAGGIAATTLSFWYWTKNWYDGWWWASRIVLGWYLVYGFHSAADSIVWLLGLPFSTLSGFLVVLIGAPIVALFRQSFVRFARWLGWIVFGRAARPLAIVGLEYVLGRMKVEKPSPSSTT